MFDLEKIVDESGAMIIRWFIIYSIVAFILSIPIALIIGAFL